MLKINFKHIIFSSDVERRLVEDNENVVDEEELTELQYQPESSEILVLKRFQA